MYWNIDLTKQPLKPSFYLCKPNKNTIAKISDAYGASLSIKLKGMNELLFNIPYKVARGNSIVANPYIHNIKFKYLIKLVYGEFESYFVIQPPSESDQDDVNHISVQCLSLENELRRRKIRSYKKEAITITEACADVLDNTNWTINRIPESLGGILASRRSFDISTKSVLEALTEIGESFKVIAQFDTVNRQINFYKEVEIGANKGLTVSDQKYLQSFLRESDSTEFCTHLNVYGKDNLSINRVSLTGESYIEDFSYFLYPFARDEQRTVISHSDYMSDELCHAILDYQDLLFSNKGNFDTLLDEKAVIEAQLIPAQNALDVLEIDLQVIADAIEVQKQYGGSTDTLDIEFANKTGEVNAKKDEISGIQAQLNAKNVVISDLRIAISKENNFTPELLSELIEFIEEDEWSDSNHYDDQMLYAAGLEEFERRKFPPMSLSVDIINFLSVITEQNNWNKLSLGDSIRFKKEEMGIDLKANLIEATFDFDGDSISVVVSNLLEVNDIKRRMMRRLYKSENAADVLDINKGNWNDIGENLEKYIDEQISEAQESLDNFNRDLQRSYADGFITKAEANFLKLSLNELEGEASDLIEVAVALGITTEKDTFLQSFNELETLLGTWINQPSYPITILLTDRDAIQLKFQQVQQNKTILTEKIMTEKDKVVADNAKTYVDNQIIEVNQTTQELFDQIAAFSDDSLITLAEANMLETMLLSVKKESKDLVDVATALGITTEKTSYENALQSLESTLNSAFINQPFYPSSLNFQDKEDLDFTIENVQNTKSILINKIIDLQSQAGKDADEETRKSIRNPNPISKPTVSNDGTAIDHVKNKDGSVDISFEWIFVENPESPINGFGVLVYSSDSATPHVPSLTTDYVQQVDKKSRSFILTGVTANKYYTFGVVAYRNVDTSINSEGIIRSTIGTSSLFTESPYRPESNISYEGDISGTIGGTPYDRFNRNSESIIIGTEVGINGVVSPRLNSADIIITVADMLVGADIKINAAIQSIKQSGGIVKLQEGIYKCAKPIKIPSNVALVGTGKSTILKQVIIGTPIGKYRGLIENENTTTGNINIMIKDLMMQMSKDVITEDNSMTAIRLFKAQECVIANVHILNCATFSLDVYESSRLLVTNCSYHDSKGAFRAGSNSNDIIFSENILNNIQFGAGGTGSIEINDNNCNNASIINNNISNCWFGIVAFGSRHTINGNKISGVYSAALNLSSSDSQAINNTIYNCSLGVGIRVRGERNNVSSNRVTITMLEGIEVVTDDHIIANNYVSDTSLVVGGERSNIVVIGDRNTISTNTCRSVLHQSKYGIEINNTAAGTIVKDNDLRTSGKTGAISDAGVGTVNEGNIIA